jgi:hypothetical protein
MWVEGLTRNSNSKTLKQGVSKENMSIWQGEDIEISEKLGNSEDTHLKACGGME